MGFFKSSVPAKREVMVTKPVTEPPFRLHLGPGDELFTPVPLPPHERFAITVSGVYTYLFYNAGMYHWGKADACYDAKDTNNFTTPYQGLYVDGGPIKPFYEDRHTHCYVFAHVSGGAAIKLSFLLKLPPGSDRSHGYKFDPGRLTVQIALFSSRDTELLEAYLADKQAKEQAEREAAWQPKLNELIPRYEHFEHYADEAWLRRYAMRHRDELLKRREKILSADQEFHSDMEFIVFLKARSPATYERARWEYKALAYAEGHRESREEYRARQDGNAWGDLEEDLTAEEQAIRQTLVRETRFAQLSRQLIAEGHAPDLVEQIINAHRAANGHKTQSPDNGQAPTLSDVPPAPRVY